MLMDVAASNGVLEALSKREAWPFLEFPGHGC
jgi:hypothetical protein